MRCRLPLYFIKSITASSNKSSVFRLEGRLGMLRSRVELAAISGIAFTCT